MTDEQFSNALSELILNSGDICFTRALTRRWVSVCLGGGYIVYPIDKHVKRYWKYITEERAWNDSFDKKEYKQALKHYNTLLKDYKRKLKELKIMK